MNQVVVVTGGSEGLGYAIAKLLSPEYKVLILGLDQVNLAKTAKELGCDFFVCDVSDNSQVETVVGTIIDKYHRLDVLVNNAGIYTAGFLEDCPPETIKRVIEVNTLGTMYMARAVIPQMKKQKAGTIINIISQSGLYAKPQSSVYRASKWALTGFTKCLCVELAPFNIRVTGVYPGEIQTNLFKNAGKDRDLSLALVPEEVAKTIKYLLSCPDDVNFPEIGIKSLKQL